MTHNSHKDTKKQVSAQQKPSRGGWNAAIFIICKTTSWSLISFIFIFDQTPLIFTFSFACSRWTSREICVLWIGCKPHHIPHKCSQPAYIHCGKECQHLGWRILSLPFVWSLCCRFLLGSVQNNPFGFCHLFYGKLYAIKKYSNINCEINYFHFNWNREGLFWISSEIKTY